MPNYFLAPKPDFGKVLERLWYENQWISIWKVQNLIFCKYFSCSIHNDCMDMGREWIFSWSLFHIYYWLNHKLYFINEKFHWSYVEFVEVKYLKLLKSSAGPPRALWVDAAQYDHSKVHREVHTGAHGVPGYFEMII